MALSALGLAIAASHIGGARWRRRPRSAGASGALRIANSREGQAVFAAGADATRRERRAAPSGSATRATCAGRFSVRRLGIEDTPGPVRRPAVRARAAPADRRDGCTAAADPSSRASPAASPSVDLGMIAPGARRDYQLTADAARRRAARHGHGAATTASRARRSASASNGRAVARRRTGPTPAPAPAAGRRRSHRWRLRARVRRCRPPASREPTGDALADAVGLPPAQRCIRSRRLTDPAAGRRAARASAPPRPSHQRQGQARG